MPYTLRLAKSVEKDILKLKKKDPEIHKEIFRKVERILNDPYHTGHPLRSKHKGVWETHVKNNLLCYTIDENSKTVELVQYIDHDKL